jgi:hypothetical protein
MREQEAEIKRIKSDKKEKLLDERKKQILNKLKTDENVRTIKVSKKPLKKIGFLIILLAIFGLLIPNFVSPWYYIECKLENPVNSKTDSYKAEFRSYSQVNDWDQKYYSYFVTPEVSYYVGVFFSYFYTTPTDVNIGFLIILLLGICVVLFEFFDKKKDFSFEFFTSIQAILYSLMLIPLIFISVSILRFIGSYFLQAHHFGTGYQDLFSGSLYEKSEIQFLLSPASIIVMLIVLFSLLIVFTVIETDLRTILKEMEKREKEKNKPKTKMFGARL